jgi:hypothetical protein
MKTSFGPCIGCARPLSLMVTHWCGRGYSTIARTPMICADCQYGERLRRNAERRRVKRVESICVGCGEAFVPARSDAIYCTPACRLKAWRRPA